MSIFKFVIGVPVLKFRKLVQDQHDAEEAQQRATELTSTNSVWNL